MKRTDDPFLSVLPSVDLHGMDRISAKVKVKEFINDNIKLKNYNLIIIHGKGSGLLKKEVHEYLKENKNVIEFKTDNFNDGLTVVKLKEEEK